MPPPYLQYYQNYIFNAPSFQDFRGSNGGNDAFSYTNHTASADKQKDKTCENTASDPVVVSDGAKVLSVPLFSLPGEMGLNYALYYRSVTGSSIDALEPWSSSISYELDLYCGITDPAAPCDAVTLYRPDGSSLSFTGNHSSYGNFPEIGGGGLATLVHNADGTWTLHDEDATTQTYDAYGSLTSIKDVSDVGWAISTTQVTEVAGTSSGSAAGSLCPSPEAAGMQATSCPGQPISYVTVTTTTVTHTDGQSFTVVTTVRNAGTTYMSGTVVVTDPAGNQYTYTQTFPAGTEAWDVGSLTFPGTSATTMTFSYTGSKSLLSGVAYNGTAYWATQYDSQYRVINDGAADGTEQTSIQYATTSTGMVATITNPLGMTTTNTYKTNAQGDYDLVSLSNSAVLGCGSTTKSLAWDSNDNMSKSVDSDGVTHTYDYAANGQLQTQTEAAGTAIARTTHYAWDPDQQLNRLLSATVPGESRVSYTYNAQNRLASSTVTNLTSIGTPNQSLTTTYAYTLYSNGMVHTLTVTSPSPAGGDHTTYVYDTYGNLTSATDGLGHATIYSGYNGLGEVGKVVGPNGAETDYTYDARGRVATKTTHPNGTAATWTYAYDGFGLLAGVTAPDGEVTTWTRDAEKRVKTITHNDKDGASTGTFGYDASGNVISDVIARGGDIGKSTAYVYNALGEVYQVKGSHGQVLTYAYDGNGNVLSVTDALGHKTSYAYDALNRVVSKTDAEGGVTHYSYDNGDHVASVTDPRGLITTYSYDGLGQKWKQVSPDTGTTSFVHDADGRLASTTRADGTQTAYAYDALNRLTDASAGGASRQYLWDACTDGKGRLCAASSAGSNSVGFAYSPEDWVTAKSFVFSNGPSYSLGYSYNDLGALTKVLYPDGNSANYYYQDGAVYQVGMQVGSYYVFGPTNIDYAPMDLAMTDWTGYNGLANTIAYDSDGRPTAITSPGVEALSFSYDADNRITHIANGVDNTQSETLGYDALNRLTSVASTADNESYQYDADGNRTQQVVNGVTTAFTYTPGSNQLASAAGDLTTTYGYDAEGNTVTLDGKVAYQYGPFNRLVNAGGDTYALSAEGQRIAKVGSGDATYLAPGADGTLLAGGRSGAWLDYVWLNGRLVTVIANGGVYTVASDQTGRPLVLTHPTTKAVLWRAAGQPFGRTVTQNNWGSLNLGFPGQYYDSEDGLWYNGQRDYDASLGRYIESDPIGLGGGVNTYAYVGDNPISNVDPLGLCDKQKCTDARAMVGALGSRLSSIGSAVTWTGVAAVGVSGVGAILFPEAAPAEIEGGVDGVGLIEVGGVVSTLGTALTGYAQDGVRGAAVNAGVGLAIDRLGNYDLNGLLPDASEASKSALSAILGEVPGALQQEEAACNGH
jgi:RHS repeat-associated protein